MLSGGREGVVGGLCNPNNSTRMSHSIKTTSLSAMD